MTRLTIISMVLLASIVIAGCGTDSENSAVTLGSADIIGTVTEVKAGGAEGISGTFQLEVKREDTAAQPDQYVITVGNEAPVYRQVGDEIGDLGDVGFEALQADQRVEVWITGPVAESFPMQARAEFIVIVSG